MKRVIITIALTAVTCSLYAQTNNPAMDASRKEMRKERREEKITLKALEGKDISFQSKEQFDRAFNNVSNIVWTHDMYFDKVSFINSKGVSMSAYYDSDAQLVGTTSPAKFTDLPVSAQIDIAKHYTNYEHAPVIFYDDNEENETDMILYGMQFDDADNYFIELRDKKNEPIVLKVNMDGNVSFFANMNNVK